ncbi:MAG: hypothetical protein QOH36_655 [Actinomycetota bacterium]|nr:hypothetical protein [Actinomycetota bacterium]
MTADNDGLVTVRIVGLPVPVHLLASEHGDELMREFALIAAGSADGSGNPGVPARLTALVEELRGRFSGFTLQPESELADAAARGSDMIDLEYQLPAEAVQAATDLEAMLDEADDFCRNGDLLTLATPPEALAYRQWFLGEFARQAAGGAPVAWADWDDAD